MFAKRRKFRELTRGIQDRYYEMNPETDILIPDGSGLMENMVVLIDGADNRVSTDDLQNNRANLYYAREKNRWGIVTCLSTTKGSVRFVVKYEDGTKRVRDESIRTSWLAKKYSVSEESIFGLTRDVIMSSEELLEKYGSAD